MKRKFVRSRYDKASCLRLLINIDHGELNKLTAKKDPTLEEQDRIKTLRTSIQRNTDERNRYLFGARIAGAEYTYLVR